ALMVTGGPMLNGRYEGQDLGACTDCRRYWTEYRAGTVDYDTMCALEDNLCRSAGHCMVMGTASTMASCAEALGMMLPGGAGIPMVMKELEPLLNKDCLAVTGLTVGEHVSHIQGIGERAAASRKRSREVVAARDEPLDPEGGLAILRGSLCPDGAVIKHIADS